MNAVLNGDNDFRRMAELARQRSAQIIEGRTDQRLTSMIRGGCSGGSSSRGLGSADFEDTFSSRRTLRGSDRR
jgi:hypothetical protein